MDINTTNSPLGKQVMQLVNRGDTDALNEFIEFVVTDHRTLQQSFFKEVVIPLLEDWAAKAENENHYDARNEATCKMAQTMLKSLGWPKRLAIPYI